MMESSRVLTVKIAESNWDYVMRLAYDDGRKNTSATMRDLLTWAEAQGYGGRAADSRVDIAHRRPVLAGN